MLLRAPRIRVFKEVLRSPQRTYRSPRVHSLCTTEDGDDATRRPIGPSEPSQNRPTFKEIALRGLSRPEKHMFLLRKGIGELSVKAQEIEQQLSKPDSDPIEFFNKAIRDQEVTTEVVHLVLKTQFAKIRRTRRKSRAELLDVTKSLHFARTILLQIWQNKDLCSALVLYDRSSIFYLCYFGLSEGLEDILLAWLSVEWDDDFDATMNVVWRDTLLQYLVAAHAILSTDHSQNGALNCFFKAVDMQEENSRAEPSESSRGLALMSLRPATIELIRVTQSATDFNTDPQLFDRLIDFVGSHKIRKMQAGDNFNLRTLYLYHPKTPKEGPALEVLKSIVDQPIAEHFFHQLSERTKQSFVCRTINVARANGNWQGAAWVKYNFKEYLPPPKKSRMRSAQ